jgi:hypothetical protein
MPEVNFDPLKRLPLALVHTHSPCQDQRDLVTPCFRFAAAYDDVSYRYYKG